MRHSRSTLRVKPKVRRLEPRPAQPVHRAGRQLFVRRPSALVADLLLNYGFRGPSCRYRIRVSMQDLPPSVFSAKDARDPQSP